MTQEEQGRATPNPEAEDSGSGFATGTTIAGRYRIVGLLGKGAMGTVYEGQHLDLGSAVAIKVLPASGGADPRARERFQREARAMAAVSHPNIVVVTDYGVIEDHPFLVMQRLEGQNLRSLINSEAPLSLDRAVDLLQQLLAALQHAHDRGLVHRDLKPANVWIETHADGEHVRVLDFGFAKFTDPSMGSGEELTAGGIAVGTPSYMSPEQAAAVEVDGRSDLYAAGILLYEMLTGTKPFTGSALEIVQGHMKKTPPPLSEAYPEGDFKRPIEKVVAKALQKDPDDRYQSAVEMAKDLGRIVRGSVRVRETSDISAGMAGLEPGSAFDEEDLEELTPESTAPMALSRGALLRRRLLWVAAGIGLTALAGIGAYAVVTDRLAPPPEPQAPTVIEVPVEPEVEEETPPWELWPASAKLDTFRERIDSGEELSPAELRELSQLARARPHDPRPELLLGEAYHHRLWLSDAMNALERAYRTDARIAESPDFRKTVAWMVRYEATSEKASGMVRRIYGRDAVPALEEVLAAARGAPEQAERVEALVDELESQPPSGEE